MPIVTTPFDDRIEYYCTGSGAQTLVIPDGAYKINYELVGGRGGTGGTGYGHPGGTNPWSGSIGGYGQLLSGELKPDQFSGKTITLNVGQNGTNGDGFSGSSGGGGGTSGGQGGYNYSESDSGGFSGAGGAGGGGSSRIRVDSTTVLVAGGGGGGAGGQWFKFDTPFNGQTSENVYNQNDNKSESNGNPGII